MVTIIIPLYNVEKYVEVSLMSALNQTYEDIEYILVNDCSIDNTMKIVREIVLSHPRSQSIKIFQHTENRGLSAARNTGLEHANGEYVFFMDSDDEITLDCIEKHYNAIISENADFTVGNIDLIGQKKSVHIKPISIIALHLSPLESYFARMWNISACNKLYRKEFLVGNGLSFQAGLLFEDILWSYFVAKNASKLALVESATYKYFVRSNSITTQKNKAKKIDSLLFIFQTIYEDVSCDINIFLDKTKVFYFFDTWRFNTALLLLNYVGSFSEAQKYYKQLKSMMKYKSKSFYFYCLKMPFIFFYLIFKPAYFLYKKYN